jgi:hypothetical protein
MVGVVEKMQMRTKIVSAKGVLPAQNGKWETRPRKEAISFWELLVQKGSKRWCPKKYNIEKVSKEELFIQRMTVE